MSLSDCVGGYVKVGGHQIHAAGGTVLQVNLA